MTILYSETLDKFADKKVLPYVKSYKSTNDWVEVSTDIAELFYFGITMPEGKQRKAGAFEIEDIPTPTNSELFAAEFEALKAEHESEINQLNLAFASAALVDGAAQESKQAEIRAAYQLAVSENQASVSALMVKYYG